MTNREQLRASAAYREVSARSGERYFPEFVQRSKNLPVMLRTNGLLATWGFLCAKERDEADRRACLEILQAHLTSRLPNVGSADANAKDVFRRWIGQSDGVGALSSAELRALTDEAIAFSGWIKRAAEAFGDA